MDFKDRVVFKKAGEVKPLTAFRQMNRVGLEGLKQVFFNRNDYSRLIIGKLPEEKKAVLKKKLREIG